RHVALLIAEFQGIQWMLADMSIALAAAQALIYKAAGRAGNGFPDKQEAAQAKVFASDTAVRVTSDALQICGAMGYSRNRAAERKMRDARMFPIAGGTAQILRTQIAGEILGMRTPQTRDGYLKLAAEDQAPARKRGSGRTGFLRVSGRAQEPFAEQ